jgi:cyclopropane-fatty-acyl-phospholipid synthase
MNTRVTSIDAANDPAGAARPSHLDRLARRLVLSRLRGIRTGQIVIREQGERLVFGHLTDDFPLAVQLQVIDPTFYSDIAFGGMT